jgi:uncharacterized DUF497 family protein
MQELEFEWDLRKSSSNARKHGVTFEEARSAFYDETASVFDDPDHSQAEDRFLLLGLSLKLRVLVVCHCLRVRDTKIRIISARRATSSEQSTYWSERK